MSDIVVLVLKEFIFSQGRLTLFINYEVPNMFQMLLLVLEKQ